VAFSGGPDSACLLHLLINSKIQRDLKAVHVDHGLDHGSRQRSERAELIASRMGVRCIIERVQVRRSGSIEANARYARYQALRQHMAPGSVLVTAHHANDVAETMLLRLLRGSGPAGLAGIPAQRPFGHGHLIRPLLTVQRKQIEGYLDTHGIESIRDPANDLVSLDRNFLRHEVLPLLKEHFPGFIQAFLRSANLNRSASEILEKLAVADFTRAERAGPRLELAELLNLVDFQVTEALRHWCIKHSKAPPPGPRLDEFIRQLRQADSDRQPVLDWDEGRLQRYGNCLWLQEQVSRPVEWKLSWDGVDPLELPGPAGTLLFSSPPHGLQLRVCSGQPGERLKTGHCNGRNAVKKLLAEAGVPPWNRSLWPRIWHQDRLVAVADRWMDPRFADDLKTHGCRLTWISELSSQRLSAQRKTG
jgi:tRNA(Ile)-lysidine synthase